MFSKAMQDINNFLSSTGVTSDIFKDEVFKGVFIKKLSNSNILNEDKKDIKSDGTKNHQTHLDITGQENIDFFFSQDEQKCHINRINVSKDINVTLIRNNIEYINKIDSPKEGNVYYYANKSYIPIVRKKYKPYEWSNYSSELVLSKAIKKMGHSSKPQVQINTPDSYDEFNKLRKKTYKGDVLVLLKKDENNFVAIVIPEADMSKFKNLQMREANKVIINNETVEDVNNKDITYDEEDEIIINFKELKNIDINLVQGVPTYRNIPKDIGKNKKGFNKKRDYVNETKKKSLIGNFGERQILNLEKAKLESEGYKELAERVEWVSEEDDNKGYDILSYEVIEGKIITRYIEVKTTLGVDRPFEITDNEVEMSKELNGKENSKYIIARVFNINTELQTGEYYYIDGAIEENFNLRPILYKAYYGKL